jgi:hypothetical protein
MSPSFWSDEEKWFVPRRFGLGYTVNFKYVARRLGLVKSSAAAVADRKTGADLARAEGSRETPEERLRRQIEASKYEEHE